MSARKFTVTAVSDGAGAATAYSPYVSGYIDTIQYVKTDYTDGVDITVTAEATGEAIWAGTNVNVATVVRPRAATHSTAGVALVYAAAGSAVNDRIGLGRDRVKIVIAQAGAAHTGAFVITVGDQ